MFRSLIARSAPVFVAIPLAALFGAGAARGTAGDLTVVADTGLSALGEETSLRRRPAISADGRFVAYVVHADIREHGDPLYLRDVRRGVTVTVDRPEGPDLHTDLGSSAPVLSDNGRYLAFASADPNLSSEDVHFYQSSPIQDIFVYDRKTESMTLVSRRSGVHSPAANDDSSLPSISANGRYVAYGTESSNLPVTSEIIFGGIFARDLWTETNRLVDGAAGADFWVPSSFSPDISGNGRRVAFGFQYSPIPMRPHMSDAEHLRLMNHWTKEIMLADPSWKRPRLVSRASGLNGAIADEHCRQASVSGSGRFVAFATSADNLVPHDDNSSQDIFVRDVKLNQTTLVSRIGTKGQEGDGNSAYPSISADGRYVAFQSKADNLAPGDGDDESDIFVKDLRTGHLMLASPGLVGEFSNGRSGVPAISAGGQFVAFPSTASNLSREDTNHDLTFFRYRLSQPIP